MRQTPLLKNVQALLTREHRPLSVPDLQDLLADQGVTPNKTTLYRLLERMKKEGIISEVLLDSKVAFYELQDHHHHHFTCSECRQIRCIDDPELESQIHQLEQKLAQKGFTVENHHFSVSGQCGQCTDHS